MEKVQYNKQELVVFVKPDLIVDFLLFLKNHVLFQFESLCCISGVDYPYNKYRFAIVYELLSVRYNNRLRIKTSSTELLAVDSSAYVYDSAGWYECEIWDMYGVFFKKHPNLKRILTDYGFIGYPLRKDFPLSGYIEMRYSELEKRVLNESLELSQEYRTFNFSSPWELSYV